MSKPWYQIKRAAPQAAGEGAPASAEVLIYGDIGESWYAETVTAAQFVKDIAALDVQRLTVRINSIGGSVPDGLAIYNALKRHPATVITVNDGWALSVSSLILMAGDVVQMAENAMLMIHAPWMNTGGNSTQLREQADVLDKWAEAMATSYAAKTGKPAAEVLALLTDSTDHYFTAAEALADGWIDEVVGTAADPAMAASLSVMASARYSPGGSVTFALGDKSITYHGIAAQAYLQRERMPGASHPAAAAAPTTEYTMTNTVTPPAAANQSGKTEAEIKAEALVQDQARRASIKALGIPFAARTGVADLIAKLADDAQVDVAQAQSKLLAHLGAGAEPLAGGRIETVEDETDKRHAAYAAAIMVRAGVADGATRKIVAAGNPYRGDTLLDMARASLDRAGFNHRGLSKMEVVAAAFTQGTSDFPILLENAMHKTLQSAYAVAPDTWSRFCATGAVADFRDHPRYRLGSLSNLDPLNELGEFKNKTIADGEKATIRAGTKGNVINLSRQAVVNDDLGVFIGLANQLGRAARRTIEADVYALLALNAGLGPVMDDGITLYHATHGNIGTGAALSVASVDADRVLMAGQKDPAGNDFLDLRPSVLLVNPGLGGAARVLNAAEFDVDAVSNKAQNTPNKVRGLYADIVDTPRVAGTRRYSFAAPTDAPCIEVVFLDGIQEPYIELQDGFDVDGGRYKVRLDFGVGATDYRGTVTNAGV